MTSVFEQIVSNQNRGISRSYAELLKQFPPRPITSATQADAAQQVIDSLLSQATLTKDERDYLNVLGSLMYAYEEQQVLLPDIHGVELLRVLMEERGLRQKDLVCIFKTESIVSAVLNGQRKFTIEHIQKLASYFNCSVAAFFPDDSTNDHG